MTKSLNQQIKIYSDLIIGTALVADSKEKLCMVSEFGKVSKR